MSSDFKTQSDLDTAWKEVQYQSMENIGEAIGLIRYHVKQSEGRLKLPPNFPPTHQELSLFRMCKHIVQRDRPTADCRPRWYDYRPMLVIDMPREEGQIHGTSVEILCDKASCGTTFTAEGDLVVPPESVKLLKDELKKHAKCMVTANHQHKLKHVHVACRKMEQSDVRKMMNLIKTL